MGCLSSDRKGRGSDVDREGCQEKKREDGWCRSLLQGLPSWLWKVRRRRGGKGGRLCQKQFLREGRARKEGPGSPGARAFRQSYQEAKGRVTCGKMALVIGEGAVKEMPCVTATTTEARASLRIAQKGGKTLKEGGFSFYHGSRRLSRRELSFFHGSHSRGGGQRKKGRGESQQLIGDPVSKD